MIGPRLADNLPTAAAEEAHLTEVRGARAGGLQGATLARACQVRSRVEARGHGFVDDSDAVFMATYLHRTLHEVCRALACVCACLCARVCVVVVGGGRG